MILLAKLKNFRVYKSLWFFLAILFFFSACQKSNLPSKQHEISSDERIWMEKFFDDLLFVEGAAYTLWGSKPITEIILYHYSTEELEEMLKNASAEQLENCYVSDNYDLALNWEKWEKIHQRFPSQNYLLFRSHFDDDFKASFVYFVNIPLTVSVLQDHYELFRKTVGFEFNPKEVVLDLTNYKSTFWSQVRTSDQKPLLWGLLFGYGSNNAYEFYAKYFTHAKSKSPFIESASFHLSHYPPKGQVITTLDNLDVPSFISFSETDEVIVQYQKDRDAILETYKGKDHLKTTLDKLLR